jgi:hypothetical protein
VRRGPRSFLKLAGPERQDPCRFTEIGPRQTRVELEHRDLDRFGAARDEVRSALDSEGGWGGLMLAYAQTAEAAHAAHAHAAQTANAKNAAQTANA